MYKQQETHKESEDHFEKSIDDVHADLEVDMVMVHGSGGNGDDVCVSPSACCMTFNKAAICI